MIRRLLISVAAVLVLAGASPAGAVAGPADVGCSIEVLGWKAC